MSSAIVRQWMILSMLPTRPRRIDTGSIDAALRARGIEVHRRTIQRDLIELADVFPIVADERAKPFGWRWADDATFVGQLPCPRGDGALAPTVDITIRVARTAVDALVALLSRTPSVEIIAPASLRPRRP